MASVEPGSWSDPAIGTSLVLRYTGPSVRDGSMGVYDAATNMMAFADFVTTAARTSFGADVEVKAEVRGFREGSFATEIMFQLGGQIASVYAAMPNVNALLSTIKNSIDLFKHLRGAAPAKIEQAASLTANVTNNNGQVINVRIDALNLTLSERGGDAVQKFLGDALRGGGLETASIDSSDGVLAEADEADADSFRRIDTEMPLLEQVTKMALVIEAPYFRDGPKWRFSDGQNSMAMAIEDEAFLARVDLGEPFRKGDVLIAEVRTRQTRRGNNIRAERAIVRVIEHKERGSDQIPLISPR